MTKILTKTQRTLLFTMMTAMFAVSLLLAVMPTPARAAGLTEAQIQAVLSLLSSFNVDQATVNNVDAALHGQSQPGAIGNPATPGTSSVTFTALPNSGTTPLTIEFEANGFTPLDSNYSVDFGDGSSAVVEKGNCVAFGSSCYFASHVYTSAGTYTARLIYQAPFSCASGKICAEVMPALQTIATASVTATSQPSCTLLDCAVGYHSSGPSCSAAQTCVQDTTSNVTFSAWPTSGAAPLTSYMTISGVTSASSYSVNFGDGTTGSNWQADTETAGVYDLSHIYTSAGKYVVQLLQGSNSCTGSLLTTNCSPQTVGTAGVTVTAPVTSAPTAGTVPSCTLTASQSTVAAGQAVSLMWVSTNATYSSSPNGNTGANGTVTVTPTATTIYQKTVYGPGGSATCQATVMVSSSPSSLGGYAAPQNSVVNMQMVMSQPEINLASVAVAAMQFPFAVAINSLANIFVELGIGQQ